MSETLWLSKAEVKKGLPIAKLLQPGHMQAESSHHLVWSLFGDHPDRKRDFLYRELKPGVFYLLSERQPEDPHGLFDLMPPKAFNPHLNAGDSLEFTMRVNATKSQQVKGRKRSTPHDVVMALKKEVGKELPRRDLEHRAALTWFENQGERYGFEFQWSDDPEKHSDVNVLGYETQYISRTGRSRNAIKFGILELSGVIKITEPGKFTERLAQGFGRAKAYGCGLMLIRRMIRQGMM